MESRKVADLVRESFHNRVNDRIGFSQETLHHLLGSPDLPHDPPTYRVLRRRNDRSRIAIETETRIFAVMSYQAPENYQFRPPVSEKVTLYLPHLDESPESTDTVLSISTRGSGESLYNTCGGDDYFRLYDADYFYSSHCWMLGFPLAGRKAYDLLRVVQLLRAGGCKEFELHGRGCGALTALYAAPFIPDLSKLNLSNCLPSLGDIVEADMSRWPQSVLVPGILNYMDLPDIIAEVEKRCVVEISEPGNPLSA
ncbi:MAG: hypothetical protein HN368_18130 [Spirochaetales bacterium]|nr:hypothetical protein [Spirochaetales bacterium]